jgi:salicylate hydroxylase
MLPFLAQGAAQAIEDAAALTGALLNSANPAEGFLLYQQRRMARAHRIQAESSRQGRLYHLAGPAAFARNIAMRLAGPGRLIERYGWIYQAGSAGKAVG